MESPLDISEESVKQKVELQRLGPRHHRILELYLQGFKPGEIARELGVTREGITWVVSSPCFQHELARRRKDRETVHDQMVASTVGAARAKIEGAAEAAADGLIDTLSSQDERVRLMGIKEILDRAGASTASKTPVSVQILSPERVQLLIQSINESKGASAA